MSANSQTSEYPEIWAGFECTINRIENNYKDQLLHSGHYDRLDDIDKIAELGFKALRYPILWERHENEKSVNWDLTGKIIEKIISLNIKPVAGLLHHGSGPAFTSLDDPDFAKKFSQYAKQVAINFPALEFYTPINEPLTTARFCGLYGHWYPHKKSTISFLTMLLNQLKGIVLAMNEIKKISPNAKLIQTEDLSKTYSSDLLQYQAQFENQRRWLTYDFLCGKVDKTHPLWDYMISSGIQVSQLAFFTENPCIPDIMGWNYYVTSERWLDERVEDYPVSNHGGNNKDKYADVEAVRAFPGQMHGISVLLREAWEKYHLPIVITEAHLSCTREEQIRWFKEIWNQSCSLKNEGIYILAVVAWSLLGAFDWDSLLTQNNLKYESGIFDVRNNFLRPTLMTSLVRQLTKSGDFQHPLLHQKGWWHKGLHVNTQDINPEINNDLSKPHSGHPPILIIGKNGTLGTAFSKICAGRSIPFRAIGRSEVNIENENELEHVIEFYQPWAIINATGYVKVDDAEKEREACFRINSEAPAFMAKICNRDRIQFMTFSSDQVFGGNKFSPYIETDRVNPLNVYGRSKANGEILINEVNPGALIIRTSTFFGPWDKANFIRNLFSSINLYGHFKAASDIYISPTYVPDLVNASLDLLIDNEKGIWHLSNDGSITWYSLALGIAKKAGLPSSNIIPLPAYLMNFKAKRPQYSVLSSKNGIFLPSLKTAIESFFNESDIQIPDYSYKEY